MSTQALHIYNIDFVLRIVPLLGIVTANREGKQLYSKTKEHFDGVQKCITGDGGIILKAMKNEQFFYFYFLI